MILKCCAGLRMTFLSSRRCTTFQSHNRGLIGESLDIVYTVYLFSSSFSQKSAVWELQLNVFNTTFHHRQLPGFTLNMTVRIKATKQYFPVVLFVMQCEVFPTFQFDDEG